MNNESINQEGMISSPVDCAKNSNTDQEIEIIEMTDSKTKEKVMVKILKDPSNYCINIQNLTDKDLYNSKVDCNGIPLLNKIEKYPNLPEDVFIPVEYVIDKLDLSKYLMVNKRCEFINTKTNRILGLTKDSRTNYCNLTTSINGTTISIRSHILSAITFLIVTDRSVYSFVNHIDHTTDNNNLSNLEFVTPATNANKADGYCNPTREDKLMEYVAYDKEGKEVYRINRYNTQGFSIDTITGAIRKKGGVLGEYIWKRARLSKKEITLNKLGYTWNPADYIWYLHWKYPDMYVCKEGFIFYKGKILCSENNGYIFIALGNNSGIGANRIIAEFLLGRNLTENEIVDHINTNTLDNSFENLRVTDNKGNMNNTLTRSKITEQLILTDLYGDFVKCDFPRELTEFIGKKKSGTINLISSGVIQNKYICIRQNDKNDLLKKMENIIYIYKNNKLIDAVSYNNFLLYLEEKLPYSRSRIQYYVNNKIPMTVDGNVYNFKFGEEAVDEVIKLGHGNAYKYIPEDIKQDPQTVIDYDKYKHLITPVEILLNYKDPKMKPIKEYDLTGKLLNQYDSIISAEKCDMAYKVIIGECFSGLGMIWCEVGKENELEEKLKYVYYKYDDKGNILDSNITLGRLFKVKTNNILNKENQKEYNRCKEYLNTGVKSPNGFYYRQGIEPIDNDPDNTELKKKREEIKWVPKKKKVRKPKKTN